MTDYSICPYCNTFDQDWWDGLPVKNDGDSWIVHCYECGKDYKVTLIIEYNFDNEKL